MTGIAPNPPSAMAVRIGTVGIDSGPFAGTCLGDKVAPKAVAHIAKLKRRSGLLLRRRSSRSVTSSPRFLAAPDCHSGSMSLALKTGAAAGAVRNLISDLAASAFLLALDTPAMNQVGLQAGRKGPGKPDAGNEQNLTHQTQSTFNLAPGNRGRSGLVQQLDLRLHLIGDAKLGQ